MAISNLGAINELPTSQLPSGYTKPVVATFSNYEYVRSITLNVLKATVETSSAATTMAAIFNNATVGINKQIVDIIAADYLATAAVTTYGSLQALSLNTDDYLTNAAVNYKCVVKIYVKAI